MKKHKSLKLILAFLLLSQTTNAAFSVELNGIDLQAVSTALNSKLHINDYKEAEQKLEYLQQIKTQLAEYASDISQEAKIITNGIMFLEEQNVVTMAEFEKLKQDPKSQKQDKNQQKNPERQAAVMKCYNEFKDYAQNHSDLSSHFYFHYKEAEFATLPYLSTSEQLKIMTNVLDDYKKIEKINPDLSENLFSMAAMLYFMPAILGGSKKEAEEKITRAISSATTTYEKASAQMMYSQMLFEKKNYAQATQLIQQVLQIVPENLMVQDILKMNKAGFSMFEADKFQKAEKKAKAE